ncbi:YkgJ family cysteine cluster protein [Aquitalea sp. LB_tupeE]|uniref:YkgJ family cysteine cluster protein n=1 Tax=Aquitalea sp. LB_tupeE TaxID=2748078 RepID=UPI0015B97018|nr:YkgJ family cysteine cluster protein [Aquitalea sp. LB_tupeE]NWK79880.1 YkgJ family cysteine cluster protein [Aquitalea sp. LB_tupeE]
MQLGEQEQAALKASIVQVGQRVARELGERPELEQALHMVGFLHAAIDKTVAQAALRGQAPACQAGCASCCHLRVEVSPVEALRLAGCLQDWPEARRQDLLQRLRLRLALLENAREPAPRLPCVFLQDNMCSIYPWRPANCRKAHSFSAADCQQGAVHIQQDLAITLAAEALQAGTAQGYRQAGLSMAPLELTHGLLWALEQPSAGELWLDGKDVPPL